MAGPDLRQRGRLGGTRSADVGRARQSAYESGRREARSQLRQRHDPERTERTRQDDADLDRYHEAGFQSVLAGGAAGAVAGRSASRRGARRHGARDGGCSAARLAHRWAARGCARFGR